MRQFSQSPLSPRLWVVLCSLACSSTPERSTVENSELAPGAGGTLGAPAPSPGPVNTAGMGGANGAGMTTTPSPSGGSSVSVAGMAGSTSTVGTTGLGPTGDGYSVQGAIVYNANGQPHLFRGVNRPSLEWNPNGQELSAGDYMNMASWGANIVRLPLNQVYWLRGGDGASPEQYQGNVQQNVDWAHAAGMDVILDLHWSDRGMDEGGEQHTMADSNSVEFWSQVAAVYQTDPGVLFELYNEPTMGSWMPTDADWELWRNGGATGEGYDAVGMQALYDAVRATGAQNLVIIGGINWAYDLSRIPEYAIEGFNIVYATHPYDVAEDKQPSEWEAFWGYLAATHPVIATEFGNFDCSTPYYESFIDYAESLGVHWTAWAWWSGDCGFPSLISDWSGTPTATGAVVREALGGG